VDLQPLGEQVGCGFVTCSLDDGENRAGGADDGFLGFGKAADHLVGAGAVLVF
jgi:hypothetical protein